MEKVKIYDEYSECFKCERCNQHYCQECHEMVEVEFEVSDYSEYDINKEHKRSWEGESVCPHCYNQLIDIAEENSQKGDNKK